MLKSKLSSKWPTTTLLLFLIFNMSCLEVYLHFLSVNATGHHQLVAWLQKHGHTAGQSSFIVGIYCLSLLLIALKYGKDEYDWPEPAANISETFADRDIAAFGESLDGTVWSVSKRLFTLVSMADMSVSETQGEKNNGFDVLYHNMKHGLISSKELTEFIRERWDGRVWYTLFCSSVWLLSCLLCGLSLCIQVCFEGGFDRAVPCIVFVATPKFFAEATV